MLKLTEGILKNTMLCITIQHLLIPLTTFNDVFILTVVVLAVAIVMVSVSIKSLLRNVYNVIS